MSTELTQINSLQLLSIPHRTERPVGKGLQDLWEKNRLNAAMAASFKAQIADHSYFHPRNIILLIGSSSAGKSTILNAIREAQPERMDYGVDLYCRNSPHEFLKEHHERLKVSKDDMEHLQQVLETKDDSDCFLDAIADEKFVFKANTPLADQQRAEKTAAALREPFNRFLNETQGSAEVLENGVMDRVLDIAAKGQDVISDLVFTERFVQHPLSKLPFVRSVFVYCPLHSLVDHIADRNQKALSGQIPIQEVRAGSFPLFQYADLVRPRQIGDADSDVIDRVTRKSVEEDFDRNFDACNEVEKRLNPKEIEAMEKDGRLEETRVEGKAELLKKLGFEESDPLDRRIDLVPKDRLNLRINTENPALGKNGFERGKAAATAILDSL